MDTLDNLELQLSTEDALDVQLVTDEDTLDVSLTSDLSIVLVNNYEELINLPQINSVTLIGNISSSDLGIKLEDLTQNTYSILNCGSSTEVI